MLLYMSVVITFTVSCSGNKSMHTVVPCLLSSVLTGVNIYKATGLDNISAKLLRIAAPAISQS